MSGPFDARGILGAMGSERAPSEPERELLDRARLGDREAFDRIVEAHLPRVWRVVWRIVRHREDAEDVVQEVFLTAFRSLAEFRGDSSLSTWLHRIAVTRALNHLERSSEKLRRSSVPFGGGPDEGDASDARGAADPPVDHGPSPLQALESEELMKRLADCLERLPAPWRAVVALRDGEEHSYEEISTALSLNMGTVRSRLARARIALRDCIEGQAL